MSFDQIAHEYEELVKKSAPFEKVKMKWFTTPKSQRVRRVIHALQGDREDFRVLDLGCGIGLLTETLLDLKSNLTGLDPSAKCIEEAKRRIGPRVRFESSPEDHLPHPDAEFDLIFVSNVLHHVPKENWGLFLKEVRRVLKPNGSLLVFEHNPLNPFTRKMVRDCPFDVGVTLLTSEMTTALLKEVGFEIRETEYYLFAPAVVPQTYFFERLIGKVPLGAQHFTWAIRPR